MQCDQVTDSRRLSFVFISKKEKEVTIIDIAVSGDLTAKGNDL